jgi:predicted MFS family arabinose efflux permease
MPDSPRSVAEPESLVRGYSGRIFVVVTLGGIAVKVGKHALSPLLPEIISTLSITPFQAGTALTIMSLVFAVAQYPSGRLSDHLSRKTVLVTSLGVVFVGLVVLHQTVNYLMFVMGTAIVGLGRGLYPTAARALLSELFVERRGRAFGVNMASSDVSGGVAAGLAVVVLAVATWHAAFLPVLGVVFLSLLLLHRWSRESLVLQPVSFNFRETGRRIFRTAQIRRILVAYALFIFTIRGVLGFLPTFLRADYGLSAGVASAAFATLFGVGLVTKPIAGDLSDRLPRPIVGASVLFLGAVGMGLLVVTPSLPVIFGSIVIYAVGQKSFGPVMQAHLMDVFPDESMGGDLGAIRTVYMVFGSFGPAYVGFVASRMSYTMAFVGFSVVFFVAGVLVLSITTMESPSE